MAVVTPTRRRRRLWRWFGLGLLFVFIGLFVACWLVSRSSQFQDMLVRAIVWGPNSGTTIDPAGDPSESLCQHMGIDRQFRVDVEPGVSLSAWVVEPRRDGKMIPPRGTILVCHGINSQKSSMVGIGKMLAAGGYRAVLVDSRCHGRSGGRWLTYGVAESRDLSRLIDKLTDMKLVDGSIGAYGVSFGGSTAIQLAGIDPRVKAVVTVAAFSSMRDVVPRNIRIYAPVIGWMLTDGQIQTAITRAGEMAGFNPDDASPLRAIAKTKAHVLLIHGASDWRIPPAQGEALHAAAPDHSRLLLISGVGHHTIMSDQTGEMARETLAWFDKWLSTSNAETDQSFVSLLTSLRQPAGR